MPIRKTLVSVPLLALAIHASGAQQQPPAPETIDVASAKPGAEYQLRLVGTGALVTLIGRNEQRVVADTIVVTTPVRLVLPAAGATLAISTLVLDPRAMIRITSTEPSGPRWSAYEFELAGPLVITHAGNKAPPERRR